MINVTVEVLAGEHILKAFNDMNSCNMYNIIESPSDIEKDIQRDEL